MEFHQMFNKQKLTTAVLLCAAMATTTSSVLAESAMPQSARPVFGDVYAPVAAVSARQAQVVFYRPAAQDQAQRDAKTAVKSDALIYLDSELHTALLPSGYSAICVAAGEHALGTDKMRKPGALEGGETYFMRVAENGYGEVEPVARQEAERELAGARAQVHALSRASAVQPCEHVPPAS
jgi:OOP family OmpA-OmpF porin